MEYKINMIRTSDYRQLHVAAQNQDPRCGRMEHLDSEDIADVWEPPSLNTNLRLLLRLNRQLKTGREKRPRSCTGSSQTVDVMEIQLCT